MGLTGDPHHPTTPDGQPSGVVRVEGVVWDFGNVLIDWDPVAAIAAGVGEGEARRFLAATDFDFMAWNHGPDSGGTWDDAEAEVRRTHPHWVEHALAYRANFAASLLGEVPGTADLVRELHAAGVPQWGLTNWSDELYPHAPERFEVIALLDGVVVSGTERVAKPDRRAYELVADRMGLPLAALAFVDDRASNIEAARALGMTGVLFTGAEDTRARLRSAGLPV
ncbi:HAD family phosphatase [Nocardioides sp. NPDC092400]|uniref:HAD family hydrolase n=1 Tax=Nocardioides sp. NPDC092400 TaxID=3155196 RepID=UPI0034226910